jgi:hypothetical protein
VPRRNFDPTAQDITVVFLVLRSARVLLVTAAFCFGTVLLPSEEVLRAQDTNKPAIPPQPRTINLTQEQRFINLARVSRFAIARNNLRRWPSKTPSFSRSFPSDRGVR